MHTSASQRNVRTVSRAVDGQVDATATAEVAVEGLQVRTRVRLVEPRVRRKVTADSVHQVVRYIALAARHASPLVCRAQVGHSAVLDSRWQRIQVVTKHHLDWPNRVVDDSGAVSRQVSHFCVLDLHVKRVVKHKKVITVHRRDRHAVEVRRGLEAFVVVRQNPRK